MPQWDAQPVSDVVKIDEVQLKGCFTFQTYAAWVNAAPPAGLV